MSYVIIWTDPAQDDLAEAYLRARAEAAATSSARAVDGIEADLARDPATAGESRSAPDRIIYDLPASLLYRVDENTQMVVVLSVRCHS